jgi:hypothetical protein
MDIRTLFLVLLVPVVLASSGCAVTGGAPGPAAAAPTYQVGDRWVYRVRDGFRVPIVWEETHEVTAASPQGITVSVTAKGPTVDVQRTETWAAPGIVVTGAVFDLETRRFEPPLVRYDFPLTPGESWNQHMRDPGNDTRPFGGIQRQVNVGGYERVTTPAGTFDAIRMRVFMRLDDETFWRHPTECTYLLWYAPEVGMTVREEKEAYYNEKGGGRDGAARLRSQHAVVELVSYRRGR